MAARVREWSSSRFLVTCLGQPAPDGLPKAALHLRGRLRWLLPARLGAPGPRGAGIYRPAHARHVAGAAALEAGQRLGLGRTRRTIHVDPAHGVLGTVEEMLGRGGLELAGAAPRTGLPATRALLGVLDGGRPVAYAKVDAEDRSKLDREARVLNAIAAAAPASFVTPVVRGLGRWSDCTVLVVDALPIRGRADRDLRHLERQALAELQTLGPELSTVLGAGGVGAVPVHGDFAPWNCGTLEGRLAIWDWEDARLGLPLEDELTWRLQRLVLFRRGSVDSVVASALDAGDTTGPEALRAVLDHDKRRAPDPRATAIRRQVLSRLEERSR